MIATAPKPSVGRRACRGGAISSMISPARLSARLAGMVAPLLPRWGYGGKHGTACEAAAGFGAGNASGAMSGLVSRMEIDKLCFHPPGTENPLLSDINMTLPAQSLGLLIGRSGSGKTTLLQLIAGLSQQTDGQVNFVAVAPQATTPASTTISISSSTDSISNPKKKHGPAWRPPKTPSPPPVTPSGAAAGAGAAAASSTSTTGGALAEERMKRVGLVFQFPERHFLGETIFDELTFRWPIGPEHYMERQGETIFDELTFGWPIGPEHFMERQAKAVRIQKVLESVGLGALSMTMAPTSLSGGQQRRLALAIQLIRQPSVLLLDEPLAGLDWQARAEVASLLKELKKQCALLVVSHDLRELAPLVDNAWEMKEGGTMKSVAWPPPSADNGFMSMSSSIGE